MPNDTVIKKCSGCKGQAPHVHFAKNRCSKDGLQNYCDACRKPLARKWWHESKARDPEWLQKSAAVLRRNVFLRKLKKYNLTKDQYDALAAKGCGVCAGPTNGRGRYAFDHNHKTGKFRGLLCVRCNTALGSFLDNPYLLHRAVAYLKEIEHQEVALAG